MPQVRSTLWVTLAAFLLLGSDATLAQSNDSVCYWQSSTGQMTDLSTLCGQPDPSSSSTLLQPFLKAYPHNIQQDVIRYIEQNRDSVAAQAKTTCRILQYGGQQAAATRRQSLIAYQGSGEAIQARQATIDAYAVANYCPGFAR